MFVSSAGCHVYTVVGIKTHCAVPILLLLGDPPCIQYIVG